MPADISIKAEGLFLGEKETSGEKVFREQRLRAFQSRKRLSVTLSVSGIPFPPNGFFEDPGKRTPEY